MSRYVPRDPLLVGRLGAVLGATVWLALGGGAVVPVALLSLLILLANSFLIWIADLRRGGQAQPLSAIPVWTVMGDLLAAGVWMVASAANPRSIAFVVVLAVGAFAMYRLGRFGLVATALTYLGARVGMEVLRVAIDATTPVTAVVAEAVVFTLALLILAATAEAYRAEQLRGANALRLARSLHWVAAAISSETELETLLRSIARGALELVDADYAAVNRRRGSEFRIVAGAGLGERVVGLRAPADRGIVGAIMSARGTVAVDDYAVEEMALPEVKALGIGSLVGVPIFVHGEYVATIVVARTAVRAFDRADIETLEGLAAHAAIAVRNARVIEQARRVEALSREIGEGTSEDVVARVANEVQAAFDVEWVVIAEVAHGTTRPLAALGAAAPLAGTGAGPLGPLLGEVVGAREPVMIRDYQAERGQGDVSGNELARTVGLRATMVQPILVNGDVVAALVVATTDPHRAFDVIDRQTLLAFSESAAVALRAAAARREREEHIREAKTAAATDPLTSLANRRSFFERLVVELARQGDAPLTVAVLDANGLKALNDRFGHLAGDAALVRIGEILSSGVRDGDLVARIGGDEFAILFPGATQLVAERIMRRLAETVAGGTLPDGNRLPTIAWGIADVPLAGADVDALVDAADRAMYRQKQVAHRRTTA